MYLLTVNIKQKVQKFMEQLMPQAIKKRQIIPFESQSYPIIRTEI